MTEWKGKADWVKSVDALSVNVLRLKVYLFLENKEDNTFSSNKERICLRLI